MQPHSTKTIFHVREHLTHTHNENPSFGKIILNSTVHPTYVPVAGATPDINQHPRARGASNHTSISNISSQKSSNHSFADIVQQVQVYTLNYAEPWVDHIDPVPMRVVTDGTLTPM